jgi:single-strand DNA-binding protein
VANSYNKLILVGNLGRDGELRSTPGGKQVLSASLAVEDWSKKDDRGKPGTEWFKVTVWGKQAESLASYLLKGKTILVEGRLAIQLWTDRDGKNRYTPEVTADRVVLLGGGNGKRDEQPAPTRRSAAASPNEPWPDDHSGPITDDDIPF